jgi:hypothetical protein
MAMAVRGFFVDGPLIGLIRQIYTDSLMKISVNLSNQPNQWSTLFYQK